MTPGVLTRDLELHLSVNPSSPLFARLAEALLRNGEISRASGLCEKGLELYPNYSTGGLIHARCLAARGRYESALASLNEVVAHYPGNIMLGELEEEWRDLVALQPEPERDDAAVFPDLSVAITPEPDASVIETPLVSDSGVDDLLNGTEIFAPMPVPSIHAESIPLLQSVPPSWKPTGFIEADRIVSRTLAEIYASQGAIGEAVETYRILLNRMPDRREMLGGRLRELEERLRMDPGGRHAPAE